MKEQLTKEESVHLINLGVPKEKASDKISYGFLGYDPIFRLTDLLGILPKEIKGEYVLSPLIMTFGCDIPETEHDLWFVYYDDLNDLEPIYSKELIDSLYELCVWCLENKYLKFE